MLIQRPDAARKLQRKYGLQRMPDSVLAPEIVPVVVVHDLSAETFDDVARGCIGQTSITSAAGELPAVAIAQPTPVLSGPIEVLGVRVSTNTTQVIRITRTTAALPSPGTATTKSFIDFNQPGLPGAFVANDSLVASPTGTLIDRQRVLANTTVEWPVQVLLTRTAIPFLTVSGETVATQLFVTFFWREIPELG